MKYGTLLVRAAMLGGAMIGLTACNDGATGVTPNAPVVNGQAGTTSQQQAAGQAEAKTGALVQVSITNFKFTPKRLILHVGDTVRWTNNSNMTHTSTASNGAWNSGNIPPGGSFSFTFTATGTIPYECSIHPTLMQGLIRVKP
jgi:plastocyanin